MLTRWLVAASPVLGMDGERTAQARRVPDVDRGTNWEYGTCDIKHTTTTATAKTKARCKLGLDVHAASIMVALQVALGSQSLGYQVALRWP
jgi:hypothetical protein